MGNLGSITCFVLSQEMLIKIAPRLIVCLILSLVCLVSVTNAGKLRTVALIGNVAPDTSENFSSFNDPVLNSAGQTAFRGTVAGSSVDISNDSGIWSEGGGSLALVAREGSAAPGASANFAGFGATLTNPVLNDAGQTAFFGFLTGSGVTSSNDSGIWSEGSGSLAVVAREWDQAPGVTRPFAAFPPGNLVLNGAGQTAFFGFVSSRGGGARGIWSEGDGSLGLVARTGIGAPGTTEIFSRLESPVLNGVGQTAFSGSLFGSEVDVRNDSGIWSEGGDSLALVVREGERAPGTSGEFSFLGSPVLNDAGQIAFSGSLTGAEVDVRNDSGIWSEGSGSLAVVALEGDEAPGTSVTFSSLDLRSPVLNGAGQTAFVGRLNGEGVGGYSGIWSEGGGSLALVARGGDVAPGTSVDFAEFDLLVNDPVLNGAGQTAFFGSLTSRSNGNFFDDHGIWAQDPFGVLTLIVRSGDQLDVDDGPGTDFRTVSSLGFVANSGNEDGRRSGFNDLGQVAFRARFTDGSSGIFVSDLVAVPEPSSLALFTLAGLAILRREMRR